MSSTRISESFKSNTRDLERAYLSSSGNTTPLIKKSAPRLDLASKTFTAEKSRTTMSPKNNTKKGNLQISVSILTDELLSGKATGEYKMKNFQMVLNKIYQKIQASNILLNKSSLELKEPKNDLYSATLPAINEKENLGIEVDEHMDLKKLKTEIIDPVWESFDKLSKSKYIVKVPEAEGWQLFGKLIKLCKAMIEESNDYWLDEDDRKENKLYKILLIKSMIEIISVISKNDKIRNSQMDDDTIDVLIELFLWSNKNKQNDQVKKIYEKLIDLLCTMINIKSNKYFIPSAFVQEMDKVKRKTISHGLLSLLFDTFEDDTTDFLTKRLINTKVLVNLELQDMNDQIEVLRNVLSNEINDKNEGNYHLMSLCIEEKNGKSPIKALSVHHSPSKSDPPPRLAATGSVRQFLTPINEQIIKGLFNSKLISRIDIHRNLDLLENFQYGIEEKQQKAKIDEENKRRKQEEIRKAQDELASKEKRLKPKRYET